MSHDQAPVSGPGSFRLTSDLRSTLGDPSTSPARHADSTCVDPRGAVVLVQSRDWRQAMALADAALDGGRVGPGGDLSDEVRVDGSVTVYRLYDIGYTIALDHAAELLGASIRGRIRPSRLEARAIEVRNPPLLATLKTIDLAVGGSPRSTTIAAHLFDFGVCSMQACIPAPPSLPWS